MPCLNEAWRTWLAENVRRGCSPESMTRVMLGAGFDLATATGAVLQFLLPRTVVDSKTAVSLPPPRADSTAYLYDPPPIAFGHRIDTGERSANVLLRCERPQLVLLDDVLTPEECDEVIRRAHDRLMRAASVETEFSCTIPVERRSRSAIGFQRCEDEFIARLDRRVSGLMNWPLENGEGLRVTRYGVGAECAPHHDYFPASDAGSAAHRALGGQRVSTLIVFLNDVASGGETIFPEADLVITPRRGAAVYFRYCNRIGQVDPLSLHGSTPVREGEQWIMTKWMRQSPSG